jgi:alpha-ketoglutarate-dependent taurine dioxygenase
VERLPLSPRLGSVFLTAGDDPLGDVKPNAVLEELRLRGAILFRGFKSESADFEEFVRLFCGNFVGHTNIKRRPVSPDGFTLTVTPGIQAIDLHSEMAYSPFRPDLIWFHCVRPASDGGETTLCDGRDLLSAISEDVRQLFLHSHVRYQYFDMQRWAQVVGASPATGGVPLAAGYPGVMYRMSKGGNLEYYEYTTAAVTESRISGVKSLATSLLDWGYSFEEACFADGSPISSEILSELRSIANAIAIDVKLEAGDVLMLDNARVLHGRRSYEDVQRDIHLKMCRVPDALLMGK